MVIALTPLVLKILLFDPINIKIGDKTKILH